MGRLCRYTHERDKYFLPKALIGKGLAEILTNGLEHHATFAGVFLEQGNKSNVNYEYSVLFCISIAWLIFQMILH